MKEGIHPTWYPEATVVCSCGNTFMTGATKPELRTDICSNCHPFYTGEQRIVDTEGQVDRFLKRLQARDQHAAEEEARAVQAPSPEELITELGLDKRVINLLKEEKIETAGALMERLSEGDNSLLAITGFGRKALADVKKGLRNTGFELPEAE